MFHSGVVNNGRWLQTTGSDRRILFTTVDNTCGMTAVELGWQQLWSDAKSNGRR